MAVLSPMDFHLRRGDHRFHNMFFQRAASSRLHGNGGFFVSRNAGVPADASRLYGLLQHRKPPMQTFDFKNSSNFRNQEWVFNQHAAAARAGAINDHGPAKGLIHEMIFRKNGKPTSSHLFDVRDAIAAARTPPSSTAMSERKLDSGRAGAFDLVGSSSRPLSRTMSAAAVTAYALGDHHLPFRWRGGNVGVYHNGSANTTSSDPVVISEALDSRLDKQQEQSAEAKRTKLSVVAAAAAQEKEDWTPDLQLSLSPTVAGGIDGTKKRKSIVTSSDQEVDSDKLPLSLSLSLRGGGEDGGGNGGVLEAATGSSSKKAALGLSTLDLTMSIKALE